MTTIEEAKMKSFMYSVSPIRKPSTLMQPFYGADGRSEVIDFLQGLGYQYSINCHISIPLQGPSRALIYRLYYRQKP